jgi:hypothetical protein
VKPAAPRPAGPNFSDGSGLRPFNYPINPVSLFSHSVGGFTSALVPLTLDVANEVRVVEIG